jgi:hypothetical protein
MLLAYLVSGCEGRLRPYLRTSPDQSLLTSQLLAWSAFSPITYVHSNGTTLTAVLDLKTLSSTLIDVTNTKHDMFCPGARSRASGSKCATDELDCILFWGRHAFRPVWSHSARHRSRNAAPRVLSATHAVQHGAQHKLWCGSHARRLQGAGPVPTVKGEAGSLSYGKCRLLSGKLFDKALSRTLRSTANILGDRSCGLAGDHTTKP